jgi:hypothetical protein
MFTNLELDIQGIELSTTLFSGSVDESAKISTNSLSTFINSS